MKWFIAYLDGGSGNEPEVVVKEFSSRQAFLLFAESCHKYGIKILCSWTEGISK